MAASAPAAWTTTEDNSRSEDPTATNSANNNTNNLEMGMSGMSLVSSGFADDSAPSRKGTGSTVSTSPDDREDNTGPTTDSGSAPGSPESEKHKALKRPPASGGAAVPSPIGRGHSKTASATSPLLSLTPNSSGDADWGRQGSFTASDGPTMPNLSAAPQQEQQQQQGEQHRRDVPGFGSFDFAATGTGSDGGLMGLQTLRDRAHSSPGPSMEGFSSSPVAPRGHFSAHNPTTSTGNGGGSNAPSRPPLSSYQPPPPPPPMSTSQSTGAVDPSSGMPFSSTSSNASASTRSADSTGGQGHQNPNNISLDSSGMTSGGSASLTGFGAIGNRGHPELRQSAAEFDPSRRASSADGGMPHLSQQQQQYEHMSQKFGPLLTLQSHVQGQRSLPPQQQHEFSMERPRHVRSVSQPHPQGQQQSQQPLYQQQHMYDVGGGGGYKGSTRASMSHPVLQSYDGGYSPAGGHHKRASMPGYVHSHPNLPVHQQQQQHVESDYYLSSSEPEMRAIVGPPSMISPGHSPMQIQYGAHSRQPSDAGSAMLSSSPMSHGSGMLPRVQSAPMHRHQSSSEDDLTHPLVGEHIEVPDEHSSAFLPQGGHPLMRQHGHSLSMDQMGGVYHSDHLPTAGSSMPMPKVVYAVKFKRTQRNFVLGPRINRDLKIGTYVKVEADRGEDLGILVGKVPAEKYSFSGRSSFTAGMGPPGMGGGTGIADLKRVIRLATHDEVSLLSLKREEEEELLKICRGKVRQRGLPMHVVDAEYQFDRHKLTFFFEAEGRVDFRELVRDLFSMYKTRIWMQQLDKNTSTSSPAIMAPTVNNLQIDYGTPIIAPPSEFADSVVLHNMGDSR